VNFFEHHIGDYDQATAHLTACEDGIYSRLIRWYYASEAPLPTDLQAIQRRVRAHSRDEKAAVKTILAEFFELRDDGYHQHRCDETLAAYREAEPEREARRENARERQRRARERRQTLFDALRGHGIVPAFDTTTAELERALSRVTTGKASPPVTQPVTRDDTVTHYPLPTTHYPEDNPPLPPEGGDGAGNGPGTPGPTPYAAVCIALKAEGVNPVNPAHPMLRTLVDAGATVAEFVAAAPKSTGKGDRFAYVLGVVEGERKRAAATAGQLHQGAMPAAQATTPGESTEAYMARMAAEREAERKRLAGAGPSPEVKARLAELAGGMRTP